MPKKDKSSQVKKSRFWAFVIYPDSIPINWEEIIKMSGLKISISPLHDADVNADETQKKPHYHIIAVWRGPTTYNSALSFSKELGGTIPQVVKSIPAYYRYFTHKDNPEKAQYDEADIKCFNGFNILEFETESQREISKIVRKIINDNDVTEYAKIVDMLADMDDLLYDYSISHTVWIDRYVSSRRHSKGGRE